MSHIDANTNDDDDPLICRVPDDWEPEQADAVICFLEEILEVLHRNYDYAVAGYWKERQETTLRSVNRGADPDDRDMPF